MKKFDLVVFLVSFGSLYSAATVQKEYDRDAIALSSSFNTAHRHRKQAKQVSIDPKTTVREYHREGDHNQFYAPDSEHKIRDASFRIHRDVHGRHFQVKVDAKGRGQSARFYAELPQPIWDLSDPQSGDLSTKVAPSKGMISIASDTDLIPDRIHRHKKHANKESAKLSRLVYQHPDMFVVGEGYRFAPSQTPSIYDGSESYPSTPVPFSADRKFRIVGIQKSDDGQIESFQIQNKQGHVFLVPDHKRMFLEDAMWPFNFKISDEGMQYLQQFESADDGQSIAATSEVSLIPALEIFVQERDMHDQRRMITVDVVRILNRLSEAELGDLILKTLPIPHPIAIDAAKIARFADAATVSEIYRNSLKLVSDFSSDMIQRYMVPCDSQQSLDMYFVWVDTRLLPNIQKVLQDRLNYAEFLLEQSKKHHQQAMLSKLQRLEGEVVAVDTISRALMQSYGFKLTGSAFLLPCITNYFNDGKHPRLTTIFYGASIALSLWNVRKFFKGLKDIHAKREIIQQERMAIESRSKQMGLVRVPQSVKDSWVESFETFITTSLDDIKDFTKQEAARIQADIEYQQQHALPEVAVFQDDQVEQAKEVSSSRLRVAVDRVVGGFTALFGGLKRR